MLVWAGIGAQAQYDATFAHYFDLEPGFNPAAVGKQSKLNVTGAYALDFAGFENNPRVMTLAADMPFNFANVFHGAGVQLLNDKCSDIKKSVRSMLISRNCWVEH